MNLDLFEIAATLTLYVLHLQWGPLNWNTKCTEFLFQLSSGQILCGLTLSLTLGGLISLPGLILWSGPSLILIIQVILHLNFRIGYQMLSDWTSSLDGFIG